MSYSVVSVDLYLMLIFFFVQVFYQCFDVVINGHVLEFKIDANVGDFFVAFRNHAFIVTFGNS